jgi:protein-S-isoprenylcysteine O-methyltransferase Ste14
MTPSTEAAGPLARRIARVRVPLGFVGGALVLWLAEPTMATLAMGAPIVLAGESLRVWASGHLNKAREVTTSGPYRWLAHPLYVGSAILGTGLAVASNSGAVAAIVAVYLATTLLAAIRSEEAFLRQAFGERYDRYRAGRDDAPMRASRFSLARALANREHRAVAGVLIAVVLLVLKATYGGAL